MIPCGFENSVDLNASVHKIVNTNKQAGRWGSLRLIPREKKVKGGGAFTSIEVCGYILKKIPSWVDRETIIKFQEATTPGSELHASYANIYWLFGMKPLQTCEDSLLIWKKVPG